MVCVVVWMWFESGWGDICDLVGVTARAMKPLVVWIHRSFYDLLSIPSHSLFLPALHSTHSPLSSPATPTPYPHPLPHRYKNVDDVKPLKLPIKTGGASCTSKTDCGEGYCSFLFCHCNNGWQGPNCLVPTYKNDFPDWEAESWIIFSAVAPYVPTALGAAGVCVCEWG